MAYDPARDRLPRLRNLAKPPAGHVVMLRYKCGHLAPLAVASLLRRYGELFPVEQALFHVACSACGKMGQAEVRTMRLCEPGCGRHQGKRGGQQIQHPISLRRWSITRACNAGTDRLLWLRWLGTGYVEGHLAQAAYRGLEAGLCGRCKATSSDPSAEAPSHDKFAWLGMLRRPKLICKANCLPAWPSYKVMFESRIDHETDMHPPHHAQQTCSSYKNSFHVLKIWAPTMVPLNFRKVSKIVMPNVAQRFQRFISWISRKTRYDASEPGNVSLYVISGALRSMMRNCPTYEVVFQQRFRDLS